jgi:nucleoside-triphosphatase THEP1
VGYKKHDTSVLGLFRGKTFSGMKGTGFRVVTVYFGERTMLCRNISTAYSESKNKPEAGRKS